MDTPKKLPQLPLRYSHLLTSDMVDNLILKTEEKITEQKTEQNKHADELREAKEMYEEVKGKWDASQRTIDEENEILKTLVTIKTSKTNNGKVLSKISNTTQKSTRKTVIQWRSVVPVVLKEQDRFMNVIDLVDKCLEKEGQQHLAKDKKYNIHSIRYHIVKKAQAGLWGMKLHNEKVGLLEWFGSGGALKLKYLEQFMQQGK